MIRWHFHLERCIGPNWSFEKESVPSSIRLAWDTEQWAQLAATKDAKSQASSITLLEENKKTAGEIDWLESPVISREKTDNNLSTKKE